MREELDKKLCAEFPSIFRDRHAPMAETCMCWGMECGDGWYGLVRAICLYMDNVVDNTKSSVVQDYKAKNLIPYNVELSVETIKKLEIDKIAVVADQVKEKYGTLRFYWHGENLPDGVYERVTGAVDMAELLSAGTCERCGLPGKLRGPGWLSTECDVCADGKATMEEYNAWVDLLEKSGVEPTAEAWSKR